MRELKKHFHLSSFYQKCLLSGLLMIGLTSQLGAQVIQFSVHVSSALTATKDQDMTFGEVFAGVGPVEINLGDPGMGVFAITGNEDMDVLVELTPPIGDELTHTGVSSDVIPFTLKFAYANRGANDVNQAVVVSSGTTARFQLRQRESGPPGKPPTPPSSLYTETQTTAYVYIYGSMTVGSIDAGSYTGNVDITVTYDAN
ncbi:MAG: hypothetical protein K9M55_09015 [Candidatus Marinimicrobia bacterium]|nr:hypothetical protein [Candidatus Neomarinimicrobiota bacterium]MCF7922828.1 hypothetical protein [Candidatus Neomarinimicrobiota bacterium]